MKEEAAKHKDVELRRNREIAQLRKESRKRENTIRTLEAEKRVKEAVLKRKQEEVTALKKLQRGTLSNKAAGRVGPRHGKFHFLNCIDNYRITWHCLSIYLFHSVGLNLSLNFIRTFTNRHSNPKNL